MQLAPHIWKRVLVLVSIILLGLLVITQFKSLRPSLRVIQGANLAYVVLGLVLTMATFVVAATMYQLLAMYRLQFRKTLLVQVASGFTNRLLPAGLGGMSLIAQYLRTQQHTTSEAVAVVGMDTVIGIVGHFSLFFAIILTTDISSHLVHLPHISDVGVAVCVVLVALLILSTPIRARTAKGLRQLGHDLGSYRRRPGHLVLGFLDSLLLTMLYVSILLVSARAVGIDLPFSKVLVVFTAGSIVGNATPTPGGLVGTEAGLFGGLVVYGASNETALAAALLFRLLTYWLPIAPGVFAFLAVGRRLRLR